MPDPVEPVAPIEPIAPVVVPPVAPQVEAKPPWGTPDEFDPEKAWDLITKLREQKNDPAAAKELSELRAKVTTFEDATRTETERLQARAEASDKTAAESATELARMKAAVKFGLTEDDLDMLGTGTPEEIEVRAEKLAARLKGAVVPTPAAPSSAGQGDLGTPINGESEPIKALEAQIVEADKARNHALSIQLKQQRSALIAAKP